MIQVLYVLVIYWHCGWMACREVDVSPPMSRSECFEDLNYLVIAPNDKATTSAACLPKGTTYGGKPFTASPAKQKGKK